MKAVLCRKPSAAMVVAMLALVVAASGTAIAATNLVSGDKLIKKGSLSGNRLRKHTLTGTQINLKKLGKVPNAKQADQATNAKNATNASTATNATNATNATTATNATNATNATTAARIGQIDYRSAQFTVPGNTSARATGTATCPAGMFAVGGGSTSPTESTGADYLVDSHPTSNRTGWEVTLENDSSGDLSETVNVVCESAGAAG
jgi:hypothetical protein